MKKRIIIMMFSMEVGGVEKALLNLISRLDVRKVDLTVLFVNKRGEYLSKLPSWVKVEELNVSEFQEAMLMHGTKKVFEKSLKKFNLSLMLKVVFSILKRKFLFKKKNYNLFEEIGSGLLFANKNYDVALDFHGYSSFTTYFIAEKVSANVKATWLHSSDFDESIMNYQKHYVKYDKVFGVSNDCVNKFSSLFPSLSHNCEVLHNLVSSDDVIEKAKQYDVFTDEFEGIKIVTVGRLSFPKGQDLAIESAVKLREDGLNFKWYMIGEGIERAKLENMIKQHRLDDRIVLLGYSDNPYPYIKNCDIYVQPSRWEGYCTTISEAKILNKPIVTTDVSGTKEQITNGKTGIITDIDVHAIYTAVKKLAEDIVLRNNFKENLAKEDNKSSDEMGKIHTLLYNGLES